MPTKITSKNNDTIKYVRKLMSYSKTRDKEKTFVLEGVRLCEEALKSRAIITKIFYTEKCFKKFGNLINQIISTQNPQTYLLEEDVFRAISDTETPQGILCLCKIIDKQVNISKIKSYSNIILLENLQNPSNVGSIFRSLHAFNTDLVIISKDTCDIYNPKVLRASMGAIFKLDIVIAENFKDLLLLLKSNDFKICGAVPSSNALCVTTLRNLSKKAVVLGNEGNGISQETMNLCDYNITIPMNPRCESLNVLVAASIIAWEMRGNLYE